MSSENVVDFKEAAERLWDVFLHDPEFLGFLADSDKIREMMGELRTKGVAWYPSPEVDKFVYVTKDGKKIDWGGVFCTDYSYLPLAKMVIKAIDNAYPLARKHLREKLMSYVIKCVMEYYEEDEKNPDGVIPFLGELLRTVKDEKTKEELRKLLKKLIEGDEEEEVKIRAIVTHCDEMGPDEVLAVALLTAKYPDAEIIFTDNEKELEVYKESPHVILVGTGGDYNPEMRNFDHKQDMELPGSLEMVLEYEFPEFYEIVLKEPALREGLEYINIRAKKGPFAAAVKTGINPPIFYDILVKSLNSPSALKRIGQFFYDDLKKRWELQQKIEENKTKHKRKRRSRKL